MGSCWPGSAPGVGRHPQPREIRPGLAFVAETSPGAAEIQPGMDPVGVSAAWTPVWVVLVMLGGLVVIIVVGLAGAALVWALTGRSTRAGGPGADPANGGERNTGSGPHAPDQQ